MAQMLSNAQGDRQLRRLNLHLQLLLASKAQDFGCARHWVSPPERNSCDKGLAYAYGYRYILLCSYQGAVTVRGMGPQVKQLFERAPIQASRLKPYDSPAFAKNDRNQAQNPISRGPFRYLHPKRGRCRS